MPIVFKRCSVTSAKKKKGGIKMEKFGILCASEVCQTTTHTECECSDCPCAQCPDDCPD